MDENKNLQNPDQELNIPPLQEEAKTEPVHGSTAEAVRAAYQAHQSVAEAVKNAQQASAQAQPQQPVQPAQPTQPRPQQPAYQQPAQAQAPYAQYVPQQPAQPRQEYQPAAQTPVYSQTYQMPPQTPTTYTTGERGSGGGWIGFMRVMSWMLFAIIEISVLIGGFFLIVQGFDSWRGGEMIASGIGMLIGGTLAAFLMIAGVQIMLDMAVNMKRTASNTANALGKLDEISKKLDKK